MSATKTITRARIPWWKEPIAIGIFSVVLLASAAIVFEGWNAGPKPVDPTKPQPIPSGGTFCDPASPVQSTAFNPSTQFSK